MASPSVSNTSSVKNQREDVDVETKTKTRIQTNFETMKSIITNIQKTVLNDLGCTDEMDLKNKFKSFNFKFSSEGTYSYSFKSTNLGDVDVIYWSGHNKLMSINFKNDLGTFTISDNPIFKTYSLTYLLNNKSKSEYDTIIFSYDFSTVTTFKDFVMYTNSLEHLFWMESSKETVCPSDNHLYPVVSRVDFTLDQFIYSHDQISIKFNQILDKMKIKHRPNNFNDLEKIAKEAGITYELEFAPLIESIINGFS